MLHQRGAEVGAAKDEHVFVAVAFEIADFFGSGGLLDQLRVVPVTAREGPGEDHVRKAVHEVGDFAGRGLSVGGHAFIGDAAED